MKCPTCNSTVPVCELCEGCRRQAAQTLESTQKLLTSAQDIAAEALGKQNEARGEIEKLKHDTALLHAMVSDRDRQLAGLRADISTLQNRLGQKHVEIEQLKNSIASAVETAQSKDHAKQQSIIYAKESAIRVLEGEISKVRGWLEIAKKERDDARAELREARARALGRLSTIDHLHSIIKDLETKLKAADQAYVAMKAVAQGNLDTARKERDVARSEVRELSQRNQNQYEQIGKMQRQIRDLRFRAEFRPDPVTAIECRYKLDGCKASITGAAQILEKAAIREGWKIYSKTAGAGPIFRVVAYVRNPHRP